MSAAALVSSAGFRCACCRGSACSVVSPYRGEAPGFTARVLVRCLACGLVGMDPLPSEEELATFYGSYWGEEPEAQRGEKLRARALARARFLAAHLRGRASLRVVDVGAGFGQMREALATLAPARLAYEAVEVDPEAVAALARLLGNRAVHARVEACPGPYDLMVMSHFLEHLRDPVEYLRAQRERLAPDGLLFLEVPHADHRFKDHHQPHLWFFETETLARSLEAAGFAVLRIETCGAPVGEIQLGRERARGLLRALWRSVKNPARDARRAREPLREKLDPHLESYGGDRRWIRAVATKRGD